MSRPDPAEEAREALRSAGVHLEKREASATSQIVASSLGSILGQIGARAVGFGPIGSLVAVIGGAMAGHFCVTHRIHFQSPDHDVDDRPESPMAWSDRR